jgi:hypothetical protein
MKTVRIGLCSAFVGALAFAPSAVAQDVACDPMDDRMELEGRSSPYDSVSVSLGGMPAKVCYGRPSSNGRTMIGGEHVPYGELWRTGANEPTTVHLSFPAEIAGIEVDAGSYAIYTVPNEDEWEVIVNRSITQWGHENSYTDEVEAQEVGRATVPAAQTSEHVETFTITAEETDSMAANLVLEWENTRVEIPVAMRH